MYSHEITINFQPLGSSDYCVTVFILLCIFCLDLWPITAEVHFMRHRWLMGPLIREMLWTIMDYKRFICRKLEWRVYERRRCEFHARSSV